MPFLECEQSIKYSTLLKSSRNLICRAGLVIILCSVGGRAVTPAPVAAPAPAPDKCKTQVWRSWALYNPGAQLDHFSALKPATDPVTGLKVKRGRCHDECMAREECVVHVESDSGDCWLYDATAFSSTAGAYLDADEMASTYFVKCFRPEAKCRTRGYRRLDDDIAGTYKLGAGGSGASVPTIMFPYYGQQQALCAAACRLVKGCIAFAYIQREFGSQCNFLEMTGTPQDKNPLGTRNYRVFDC